MIKRETYILTTEERNQRLQIKPIPGEAFAFWGKVAVARGLDYKSIIADMESFGYVRFSGLPEGHDKHWCWPVPLKCKVDPESVVI